MADKTKIEWSEATWNPITGCSMVSSGCTNCYAQRLAGGRLKRHPSRVGLTKETPNGPVWTGEVRLNEQWLDQPFRWRKPRLIFVVAHGDLFHESVPDKWIDKVFLRMKMTPRHTYQVLTKRAERMYEYFQGPHRWAPDNVWLGVSAENQRTASERIPWLLRTPAAVRWVSMEPLLAPVYLHDLMLPDNGDAHYHVNALNNTTRLGNAWGLGPLDWVVVGGESGPRARPMKDQWPMSIIDACRAYGCPVFMKQLSSFDHPDRYKHFDLFPYPLQTRQWPVQYGA